MITVQHNQELLHRAYILAVAAHARLNVKGSGELDYGTNGTFEDVTEVVDVAGNKSLVETGFPLKFQARATINCGGNTTHIKYKCTAKAYNKMVIQNQTGTAPTILLVFCMPKTKWLTVTEDALTLRNACYWYYLTGAQTTRSNHLLSIPRSQLFTPEALKDIMNRIASGGRP